jgi:DNA-binding CsgD family transcriptional regulator/tetratricopeptide (TPR) repeat protein
MREAALSTDPPALELFEREADVEALRGESEAVRRTRSGRMLLLAGEAGIGKSSLMQAVCESRRPGPVLWGASDPLETPRALGPLLDVAEELGGEFAVRIDEGAGAGTLFASLCTSLKRRPPAIVVLEDLHWADEATLDFLRFAARRIEELNALLVVTYRDEELDRMHPLRIAIGEFPASPAITRRRLEPLTTDAVQRLAADSNLDGEALHVRTGGNPFFVSEVLAAGEEIPETVRDAVLARFARLSPKGRALLEAVAIVPSRAEIELLEAIAGEELAALDECLRSGMLEPAGSAVRFRHEIARATVEETLPPQRAVTLHRRALRYLAEEASRVDPARLAHHAEAAGDREAVLEHAPMAAERAAAVGAHREAAAQFERALRHADGLRVDERAALLGRAAHEYMLVGRLTEAIELGTWEAEAYRQQGDTAREAEALHGVGIALWTLGRRDEAQAAAEQAIAALEQGSPGRGLARAYGSLAQLRAMADDLEGTRRWGTTALALARGLGDATAEVQALSAIGGIEFARGMESGRETLERSVELARRGSMAGDLATAFNMAARGAVRTRQYELAQRYISEGIRHSERFDLEGWRPGLVAFRAEVELATGDWDAAAESASAVLRTRGAGTATMATGAVLGRLRARRGDPEVWPLLDRALELAAPSGEAGRVAPVAIARCEAAWLEGRDTDALAEAECAWELAVASGDPWLCGELAAWRRRVGARDDLAVAVPEPYALSLAGRFSDAAEAWRALDCPYEAALAMAGSNREEDLRGALAGFRGLGAGAAAARVLRDLRERGVRDVKTGPRASTRENPAGLTRRELEVLTLVAEGLRNADIASRLFVSERTVATHVSAILRKLEVRSRGEATAKGARLGLLES